MLSATPTLAGGDGGYGGGYSDANYKGPGWTQGSPVTGSGGVGGVGHIGSGGGIGGAAGQIAISPVNNAADVSGSAGVGPGFPRDGAGGGGDGLVTSANAINSNRYTGGNGGDVGVGVGDAGVGVGDAGGGGGGGAGLVTSANVTNTSTGSIKGGDGGTAPTHSGGWGGGAGGGGGAGLFGTGAVLGPLAIVNRGMIAGGQGGGGIGLSSLGQGGAGSGGALGGTRPGIFTPGVFAAGGAGIVGANLDITNSGTISGGLSGDGSTRAAAVLFTGGTNNSLNLQTGSLLDGAVEIRSGATASIVAQVNGLILTNNLILGGAGTLDTQANNMTVSGAISGIGSMYKTGSGTLNLTGNSTLKGTTTVNLGTLAVNGSLANSAVSVNSGGILGGSGTVGNTTIDSGGVLAPGNSIGTLAVAGDLHFLPGAIYRIEADPDSSASDRVAVTGTAYLAGSVMHVGPEGGFASMRQYTILSASAVQGQFDSVRSNYAYLDPTLRYGAQDVTLQLERKFVPVDPVVPVVPVTPLMRPIAFADAAQTGNQRATANSLDSLAADNPLHEFILTLPAGAPPAVFDNLSGEIHASVASSLIGAGATARTLPLAHLRANLGAGMQPGALLAQAGDALPASALPISNAQPAWAEVVGNWQTLRGDSNAAQATHSTGGLFIGADHAVGGGWRVGAALGYTEGKIRVDERASKADVSSYSAALYGGRAFDVGAGKLNFLAGSAYTWHNLNTERHATVSKSSQKLTADYGANITQLFIELGYAMPLSERVTVEPFAGLAWSHLRTRGFSESGGSAALSGQSGSDAQTSTTLGLRAQTGFTLGQAEGQLRATLGWRHAFGDVTPQSTLAFQGGQAFTVAGAPIARDAALTGLGVDTAIARHVTLGLSYSGQYGGGNREHTGSLNVRWRY